MSVTSAIRPVAGSCPMEALEPHRRPGTLGQAPVLPDAANVAPVYPPLQEALIRRRWLRLAHRNPRRLPDDDLFLPPGAGGVYHIGRLEGVDYEQYGTMKLNTDGEIPGGSPTGNH